MEDTMTSADIRQESRRMLEGLWTSLVPIWFVFFVIYFVAGAILGSISEFMNTITVLILGGPFMLAIAQIFLRIYRKEPFELKQLFDGFQDFSRAFTANLLISIYVFLWTLLLIVPGIIAALGYGMTFFIMAEDPNILAQDAMRKSKDMMMGHKWDLFWLGLSFIGWMLLAVLTFGIGLLWLESYMMASFVIFYENLKGRPQEQHFHDREDIVHYNQADV